MNPGKKTAILKQLNFCSQIVQDLNFIGKLFSGSQLFWLGSYSPSKLRKFRNLTDFEVGKIKVWGNYQVKSENIEVKTCKIKPEIS